jgi:hypothetical protein
MLSEQLRSLRPDTEYNISNWAIGGTRAELVLYRLLYEFWHGRERMLPLTQSQPDILVIESCAFNNANDHDEGIENFRFIWDQILAACRQHAPRARIITYLSIASSPAVPEEKSNRLFFRSRPEVFACRHKWREIYRQAFIEWVHSTRGQAVEFVDVQAEVLRQEVLGIHRTHWISADGVHPNPAGVELISQWIARTIAGTGEPQ